MYDTNAETLQHNISHIKSNFNVVATKIITSYIASMYRRFEEEKSRKARYCDKLFKKKGKKRIII